MGDELEGGRGDKLVIRWLGTTVVLEELNSWR